MTKTTIVSEKMAPSALVNFGLQDSRGRALGVRTRTAIRVFEDLPPDAPRWNETPAGTYYSYLVQGTRGGEDYGPGQRWNNYASEGERDAALAAHIGRSRKAAEKKASR